MLTLHKLAGSLIEAKRGHERGRRDLFFQQRMGG